MTQADPPQRDNNDRPEDEGVQRSVGLEMAGPGGVDEVIEQEQEAHRRLPAAFRLIDLVLRSVMAVLLAILVIAVGANVFGRFVLNNSLAGSDELARYLFIWVIFLGATLAHLYNEHIAVDLLMTKLPPGIRRWVVVLQELIIVCVMIALLIGAAEVMAIDAGTSALLGVPLWLVNFAVPFCGALIAVVSAYRLVLALRPADTEAGAR